MWYFRYISSIVICSEEQTIDDQPMQRGHLGSSSAIFFSLCPREQNTRDGQTEEWGTWGLSRPYSSAFALKSKTQETVKQRNGVLGVYLGHTWALSRTYSSAFATIKEVKIVRKQKQQQQSFKYAKNPIIIKL